MKIPHQWMSRQIRLKCLDCSETMDDVRFCLITNCPLWYFRFGVKPQTYINSNGETSKILFNPDTFEDGGSLPPDRTTSELLKIYKSLCSKDESTQLRKLRN